MEAEQLQFAIIVAIGILLGLWGSIAYSLFFRRFRRKKLYEIEATFAEVLSNYLYGTNPEEIDSILIQREFRKIGITEKNPENVQYLIDLMLRTQQMLLGRNHFRLRQLYVQLPPYRASYKKTLSTKWHIQARGIREIYEMNQIQYTSYIARFRDHPNLFVRREAQIAMVVFLGWESLRFLPYLSRNIELWQQIKIVEKLHDLYPIPKVEYLKNAYNTKNSFGRELIMRIIRKYHLTGEVDFLITHLSHFSFEVRETAIECLSSFTLDLVQLEQVKTNFPKLDSLQQQKQVLDIIGRSTPQLDLPFYLNLLYGEGEMLKLRVAEILWTHGFMDRVQQYYEDQYKETSELIEP